VAWPETDLAALRGVGEFATTNDQGIDTTNVVIGNYSMKKQEMIECQCGD